MATRIEVVGTATFLSALLYVLGPTVTAFRSGTGDQTPVGRAVTTPPAASSARATDPDSSEVCVVAKNGNRLCVRAQKSRQDSTRSSAWGSIRAGSGGDLLRRYFGGPVDSASCVAPSSLAITIVTLPDPIDSHLDWGFDAGLESINRAFERAGFVADRFWLPWADAMPASAGSSGSARADTSRKWVRYPGTFLFRRANPREFELHLVYVVGEVPTVGLHKAALRAALAERDSLLRELGSVAEGDAAQRTCLFAARGSNNLRIVGPVFSGSVPSLSIALRQWRMGLNNRGMGDSVIIVTGSATTDVNKDVLEKLPNVSFAAAVYPASSLGWFIDSILVGRMDIPHERIAMLTESSTQFGGLEADSIQHRHANTNGLLSIRFPVSIASLRTEYARHPVVTQGAEAEKSQDEPRVPLSLLDPVHTTERPGLASTELTVPAIDLAIREILRTLAAHRVRAVGIAATDVRDQLFLATIIKEHLRDVQLFMVSGNMLFLRPDLNESLLGTLVVSTYPLFLENQFWNHSGSDRSSFVFTSDLAEGIYNATLMQLPGGSAAVTDYAWPFLFQSPRQPPLWISTVGRDAFYPIATSDPLDDLGKSYLKGLRPNADSTPSGDSTAVHSDRPQSLLEFVIIAVVLMSGSPVVYFLVQRRTLRRAQCKVLDDLRKATASTLRLVQARAITDVSLMQQRELFVLLRFLPTLTLALAAALALLQPVAHGDTRWEHSLLVLGLFPILIVGALIVGRRTRLRWTKLVGLRPGMGIDALGNGQRLFSIDATGLYLIFLFGAFYITIVVLYLVDVLRLGPAGAALYFQRAVHFGSGVSPLAPIMLGAIGFSAWSWWHIHRVELLQCRTEFEEACVRENNTAVTDEQRQCGLVARYSPAPAAPSGSQGDAESRDARQRPTRLTRFDEWLDDSHEPRNDRGGFAVVVGKIRTRLLYLVPSTTAVLVLVVLAVTLVWLNTQFNRSMDASILRRPFSVLPPFDWLLRITVFGALCGSIWSLYRFMSVWRLLANLLSRIADSPLAPAFGRLPAALGKLTRLRLFPHPCDEIIDDCIHTKWNQVKGAAAKPQSIGGNDFALTYAPTARWTSLDVQPEGKERGADFVTLYRALCTVWREEGVHAASQRPAKDASAPTCQWKTPRQKWLSSAEELAAVYVVDYIEWVFQYLRGLAAFLLVALVLMTVLTVAYPFQPASVVRTVFLLIIGVAVVTLVAVLVRMNRDPVLSSIAGTNAGEVTWDATFVLNLITFAAVPIITLLGSEFPALRGFLFSWVSPALRAFTKT